MFGAVVALLFAPGLVAVGARLSASAQVGAVAVVVAGYDLGDAAFTDAQTGTVSELRAVVYFPRPLTGRLPLIVVAHGSWWACDAAPPAMRQVAVGVLVSVHSYLRMNVSIPEVRSPRRRSGHRFQRISLSESGRDP